VSLIKCNRFAIAHCREIVLLFETLPKRATLKYLSQRDLSLIFHGVLAKLYPCNILITSLTCRNFR